MGYTKNITAIKKLEDLSQPDQDRLRKWLRFKLYFYAHPSMKDLRRELLIELNIDCTAPFLRQLARVMLNSDLKRYNKFLGDKKSQTDFVARRWAIINYCGEVCENVFAKTNEKLQALNLMNRILKELEDYYKEQDLFTEKRTVDDSKAFGFTPEEIELLQERIGNIGRRVEKPIVEEGRMSSGE